MPKINVIDRSGASTEVETRKADVRSSNGTRVLATSSVCGT